MINRIFDNPVYKKHRELLLFSIDIIIVMFSYLVSYWAKVDFHTILVSEINFVRLAIEMFVVLIVYALSFLVFKIHRSLWKYVSIREAIRIGFSNLAATTVIMFLTLIIYKTSGLYLISVEFIAMLLSILIMFSLRCGYRFFRKTINESDKDINALIIGAGDGGTLILREIIQNPSYGYRVIGFIDDLKVNKIVMGKSVLGSIDDLEEIKDRYDIEVAILAIPSLPKNKLNELVTKCQNLQLKVKIMNESNILFNDGKRGKSRNSIEDIRIEDLLGRGEIKLEQDEIASYINGKVVAVTGAGGSIGSELCRQIIKFKPKRLLLIDVNENALYMLEQEFDRARLHFDLDNTIGIISYVASIRDKKALNEIMKEEKPEVVYHAAAHKHVPLMETRPMEAIKNNVFGTKNVIECCIENKVKRFIMISTDKAVNPTNVMGATKRMTEMILQAYGNNEVTQMAAVRFGNVLGSNGSVIPIFKKQIEEGGPLTITDRNIIRYFMTIPEAAQLVLQAGYYADKGEIFVLDMGEPVKIIDLAEKMIRLAGYEPYNDIDIIEIGLRPGEKMFEELHLDGETFSKTKNNLIYENKVMKISKEDIEQKLDVLHTLLENDTPKKEFRDTILELIKNN